MTAAAVTMGGTPARRTGSPGGEPTGCEGGTYIRLPATALLGAGVNKNGQVGHSGIPPDAAAGPPAPHSLLHWTPGWNSPGCLGHSCVFLQSNGVLAHGHTPALVNLDGHTPFIMRWAFDNMPALPPALTTTGFALLLKPPPDCP